MAKSRKGKAPKLNDLPVDEASEVKGGAVNVRSASQIATCDGSVMPNPQLNTSVKYKGG